ncbi:E3 ubiquitin-protein ligase TTC3 [Pelodytes ibericus]
MGAEIGVQIQAQEMAGKYLVPVYGQRGTIKTGAMLQGLKLSDPFVFPFSGPLAMDGSKNHTEFDSKPKFIRANCMLGHEVYIETPPVNIFVAADPVSFWISHSIETIKENCDIIKMYVLQPILIKQTEQTRTIHSLLAGYSNLSMKELNLIELLEDLAELVKKVATEPSLIDGIIRIGKKMDNIRCRKSAPIMEAMNWVLSTGDLSVFLKLQEHDHLSTQALQTFFTGYAFYISYMADNQQTMVLLFKNKFCKSCAEESETMKTMGNEAFTKGHFDYAVEHYSTALRFSPDNHLLFSNRALCFIRMGKYGKALRDGKKAVILKNNWPKGHYRFCEALFLFGEKERALASNEKAQVLCGDSPDGIRDLIQQHEKFKQQLEVKRDMKSKKRSGRKQNQEKRLAEELSTGLDSKEIKKIIINFKEDVSSKVWTYVFQDSGDGNGTDNKECSDITTGPNLKKGKSKARGGEGEKNRDGNVIKTESNGIQKNASCRELQMDLPALQVLFISLVHEGYTALENQRCHSAQGTFSRILDILEQRDLKEFHLSNIDYAVLQYGYASSLLGIGQCEELRKAENQFKYIQNQYSKERFNCLAVYGIGNVYFRQNRFSEALKQYVKSQTMVKHRIVPGLLNWPNTSVILEESRPEKLQFILETRIEECKFPPKPEAVCRSDPCLCLPKAQIYFTDPDFKGFIRLLCCQMCKVEFHICCWKKLKASSYSDKNDKDFLKNGCLTPDCRGRICRIIIFDATGLVKCEFLDKFVIKKEPPKPRLKGTTSRKLKIKPEIKTERKKTSEEEVVTLSNDGKPETQANISCKADLKKNFDCAIPYEIMLAHIKQKEELIRKGIPDTKEFQESLLQWNVISQEELDVLFSEASCDCAYEKMALLLKHLYRLNNRVKTRVFLYLLEKHGELLTFELLDWIIMIDDKGLVAATKFYADNEDLLNGLDLTSLVKSWNETYGKYLDQLIMEHSSIQKVIDNLFQTDLFRCCIWFLEENRGSISYGRLEGALDIYFTQMDAPYYNFRLKSFSENRSTKCIKVKNKYKKKKNQSKTVYTLSGGLSTRSQEDDIFTEENTLSLLDPYEPFLVPENLRHQVEEFETIYEPDLGINRFQLHLDSTRDSIRETLYDYFSQILEERGPLELEDEILVGEYKGFPEETHQLVEEAGGLKAFLLESSQFAMMGNLLGLDIHAALFDDDEERLPLNPTAKEFSPCSNKQFSEILPNHIKFTPNIPYYRGPIMINSPPSIQTDFTPNYMSVTYPVLGSMPLMTMGPPLVPDPNFRLIPIVPVDNYGGYNVSMGASENSCMVDKPDTVQQLTQEQTNTKAWNSVNRSPQKNISKSFPGPLKQTAIVAVQVDIDVSEHDVNTDPYQPFETQQGDILRMEKEHQVLKEQLKETTEKYDHLHNRYQEEITGLNRLIKETIEKNTITKKEHDWLNHDLENEVKKWQQEKKENQEKIKAIKNNIKSVNEANDRCAKETQEKKKQYDTYLGNFLHKCVRKFEDLRSEVEKRTKESEDNLLESNQRAFSAEINVLENKKQCEILKIRSKASKAENTIKLLKAVSNSQPSVENLKQIASLESLLLLISQEVDHVKTKFEEKIKLMKNGSELSDVLEIPVTNFQPPPNIPAKSPAGASVSASSTLSSPAAKAPVTLPSKNITGNKAALPKKAEKTPLPPATRTAKGKGAQEKRENVQSEKRQPSPAKQTPFDRIIEELQEIFPHYKSEDLIVMIKNVRSGAGGTLSGMKEEDIIARVTEYILDHQPKSGRSTNQTSRPQSNTWQVNAQPAPAPQAKQPWRLVTTPTKSKWQKPNSCEPSSDEPCIICHDELKQYPLHMLDCGHYFHKHCITKWLHTQSTCPTCRDHALLPEDFPVLSGRLRTA